MKLFITQLLIILICYSCSNVRDGYLEDALSFAGKNRVELEKVLNHYNQNQEDSLKYKAACFLIENMPYYYSYNNENLELYKKELDSLARADNLSVKQAYDLLEKRYGKLSFSSFVKIYDSHVITSEYLIRNIEHSFKVWEEKPWGRYISFDDFCEEILPYRIGNEPLEEWREDYYNYFQPVLDSLLTSADPVEAYRVLLDSVIQKKWLFEESLDFPHLGAKTLLNSRLGYCRDMTDLMTYIVRAIGLPGGVDFIVQNADDSYPKHQWNYLRDTIGKYMEFDMIVTREKVVRKRKKAKVYRQCFALQRNSLVMSYPDEVLPLKLKDPFMKDVSMYYFPENKVEISVSQDLAYPGLVYLGVFNNKEWVPVMWSPVKKGKAVFQYLDPEVMYIPLLYSERGSCPIGSPFHPMPDGSFYYPQPDTLSLQTMILYRKHRIPHWWYRFNHYCLGGKFQVANRIDFSDAKTIYTIEDTLKLAYYNIPVSISDKYKYIRYLSGKDGYNNMAEMYFYSNKGTLLQGQVVGTDGSSGNRENQTKEAALDNDPVTYFNAKESNGAWVGLAFEKPQVIGNIRFLFRNDDNNIRPGDEYELVYWKESGWIPLGKKIAHCDSLIYEKVPSNALYLLHNYTRGKEERIFTYENGKQIWW